MLSVEAAQQRVVAAARLAGDILGSEKVPLSSAAGRYLALDVSASRSLPGFDNSAMDGYAVRFSDIPGTLTICGVSAAGGADVPVVNAGQAVQIFTGAPMPLGADTVVIVEEVTVVGNQLMVGAAAHDTRSGANVRRAGEDIASGETAIAAGTQLTAGGIGLLAALGCAEIVVGKRPRVAIIATGDELVDIATGPKPGQIVDSSGYMLPVQVADAGGVATYLGIIPDDEVATAQAIAQALTYDVVITTGGVSAGERDFVRGALTKAGIVLDFWKVAMKPGKPLAFGMPAAGFPLVFALPGNPVSSLVSFELFVRPALIAMQGATTTLRRRIPVRLSAGYTKPAGRTHFLRAKLLQEGDELTAILHPKQGSAMLTSMVDFDALIEIPASVERIAPGATCNALLL
jgi:molybdopterin molybdotransferase